jgi:hypothetical protein
LRAVDYETYSESAVPRLKASVERVAAARLVILLESILRTPVIVLPDLATFESN